MHNSTGGPPEAAGADPKTYASPSDLPLWAVESVRDGTVSDVAPLWGVLGTATSAAAGDLATNVSTTAQRSLRLPGALGAYSLLLTGGEFAPQRMGQNVPGADFYGQALMNAFGVTRPGYGGGGGYEGYGDYSGRTGLALYSKWRELSDGGAEDVSAIVNLVWTDIAANSVVGTKGWGLGSDADAGAPPAVPVTAYRRRVRYRIPYAVPGFVVLAEAAVALAVAIVLLVAGRTGPRKLRTLLESTSAGRIMGLFLWPDKGAEQGTTTSEWVKTVGTRVVLASGRSIVVAGSSDGEDGVGESGGPAGAAGKGTLRERTSLIGVAEEGNKTVIETTKEEEQK